MGRIREREVPAGRDGLQPVQSLGAPLSDAAAAAVVEFATAAAGRAAGNLGTSPRCVIITTSGMLHSSRIARTSPMDSGSSMCASSTKRRKPGMDGCAGAAWVDRPNRSRCSISASALHAR